ncbi:MAG: STAS domain-containing protein [Spirochaetaceae bacterium]|nr:STAS domain-containing protein [Spirochaetaceae bacterium]
MVQKIVWHGKVSIENAEKFKNEILEALAGNSTLIMDLSRVESIDTSGVQLLVATVKEAKKQNITLAVEGHIPKEVNKRLIMGGFIAQAISDGNLLVQELNKVV